MIPPGWFREWSVEVMAWELTLLVLSHCENLSARLMEDSCGKGRHRDWTGSLVLECCKQSPERKKGKASPVSTIQMPVATKCHSIVKGQTYSDPLYTADNKQRQASDMLNNINAPRETKQKGGSQAQNSLCNSTNVTFWKTKQQRQKYKTEGMDGAQISGFRDGMESSDCRMSAQGSWLGDGIAMTQISLHALKLKELDTHTKANFTVYNFF